MKRRIVIEGFEFQLQSCEITSSYPPVYGGGTHGSVINLELMAYQGDSSKEDWARLMEVIRVGKATVLFDDTHP